MEDLNKDQLHEAYQLAKSRRNAEVTLSQVRKDLRNCRTAGRGRLRSRRCGRISTTAGSR